MLITLSAPVTIAIRNLRASSKRGRMMRLRPTEPFNNPTASSVFNKKAFAVLASTTSAFWNTLITS